MLVRMLYVSRATGPQTSTVTASILLTARAHNREHGITGVLCQGQGLYLQVLEGERSVLNRLYARIVADRRHHDVEMLLLEETDRRRFAKWSMALVALDDHDAMLRMNHPEFDPFAASGTAVMAMLDELVAAGRAIEAPPGP
jgi:Sensors of blue-light using FAD